MGKWKLANSKNIPGLLDKADKFLGMDTKLSGCLVSIPTSMDIKAAINNVGGVISAGIRSLEIWWDSEKQELQIVLIASEYDLDKFKQAFYNMYPNIDFEDIDVLEPEWFEKTKDYQIFDVGYRHGHFSTVFDQAKAHLIITQIANTIQLSKFAWIQIVFKSQSFVKELQSHLINLQNHNQTVAGQYYPTTTWLFSDKTELKDHPEKFGDFATNYKNLDKHTTLKTQNSHVLASIRGVVESNIKLDIDFSPIESLPVENIRSAMEYVNKNTYEHQNFYSEKKPQHIKVNDSKTKLQRIDMFANRLLPNPTQTLSKLVNNYVSKSWTGSYKTRVPTISFTDTWGDGTVHSSSRFQNKTPYNYQKTIHATTTDE